MSAPLSNQRHNLAADFIELCWSDGAFLFGFTDFPVKAFDLISENHARRVAWDEDLEGIVLDLACDGTTLRIYITKGRAFLTKAPHWRLHPVVP